LDPHKHEIRLYAVMIVGNGVLVLGTPSDSSYHSTMFITFKGNRIVSKDYYQSTSNKIIASALGVNGFVMLSGSVCNSIIDRQGNSLLSKSNYQKWLGGYFLTGYNQALGFRNGKGWGARWVNNQKSYIYASWDDWNQYGVYLNCTSTPLITHSTSTPSTINSTSTPLITHSTSTPSDDTSSGDELAVKIVVPVVVIAAMAGVTIVGIFAGRKIWKTWHPKRIRRAVSETVLNLTDND
ncbi:MAG: hypothetical protein ACR2PT_13465, partial [Endozoicomonas sp.]